MLTSLLVSFLLVAALPLALGLFATLLGATLILAAHLLAGILFVGCCLATCRRRLRLLVFRFVVWRQQPVSLFDLDEPHEPSDKELTTYLNCVSNGHGCMR